MAHESTAVQDLTDQKSDAGRVKRSRLAVFRRNRAALVGSVITFAFALTGVAGLAMIITPGLRHFYLDQNLSQALQPPFDGSLFGTDRLGRDMFARVVAGTGVSLAVAGIMATSSILIGGIAGMLAGYRGGRIDLIVSGLIDITWGFPIILVAIVLAGVLSPGLTPVVLAISLVTWAGFARIIRGEVISLREQEFVRAAHAIGAPSLRIMLRHLVPNVLPSTLVMGSYYVAITIPAEAALSFIGVGAQPPTPSLGQIIADGREYLTTDVYLVVIPSVILAFIVIGLNTLGDGLRDLVDPRLRARG